VKKSVFVLISVPVLILVMCSCTKQNESAVPVADFSVSDTLLHVGEKVSLRNFSDSSSVLCFWNFGDGSVSYERNPIHSYSAPGDYLIRLRISYGGHYLDSTFHNIRVGEQFVYGISVYSVSTGQWYPDDNLPWDPDSTGLSSLPDIFVTLRDADNPPLFESSTVYNVESFDLPLYFQIPDIKINSSVFGQIITDIAFNDRDDADYIVMTSNQCSGSNRTIESYDNKTHTGEFSVEFLGGKMLVKYKIK
jgi:hypothetical protein